MKAEDPNPERAAAEWFIALREDPDDAELRARFAAWRDADPRHLQAWAEMGETARIMRTAPPARRAYDLPDDMPRSRRLRRRSASRPARTMRQAVAVAAVACLALILTPVIALRLTADYIAGTGEVKLVLLADGSTVQLGPDSAIAVDYGPDGRMIRLLSGQAMFEVLPDPARPFQVTARGVRTTVLGTGFEVRIIGATTGVAVRHGRVRVEDHGRISELGAGAWVRFAPGMPIVAGTEAPELIGEWRTGKVAVRNQPIADAIDEMRPWYAGKIILADRALGQKLISGSYNFRDPARSLDLLVTPYGGQVYRISPWVMVVTTN